MIISLPELLLSIVLLAFLWVALDWFLGLLRDRSETARLLKSRRHCHLCGKIYPEDRGVKLSECPDCSARNIRGGHRKLG